MRISVFGNCQAAPIRSLLAQHPDIDTPDCPLNYMVTADDEAALIGQFEASDLIFAQRIADDYRVEWARSKMLRERFGDKLLVWPSVYFDGYYPDIQYLYYGSIGKVVGPLSDYHFGLILDGFWKKMAAAELAELLRSDEILKRYPDPVARSLAALREREQDCDAVISDFIEANFREHAIQFTPNHPCLALLATLATRLCRAADINFDVKVPAHLPELDHVYIPPYSAVGARYAVEWRDTAMRGLAVSIEGQTIELGSRRTYTIEELVETYYAIYEATLR